MAQGTWVSAGAGLPDAALRLFCFPHAGGGAGFFRPWRAALGSDVEVCSVVLPGREARLRETPYRSMTEMLPPLTDAIAEWADRPYAILGHSTGAAVGYEVARRLAAHPVGPPRALLVSGRRSPYSPPAGPPRHLLPQREFLQAVFDLGGTPPELLGQPELLELFLPALRGDFALNETYRPLPGGPLDCPVTAFTGQHDPEVTPEQMTEWRRVSTGPFGLRVFRGGHFYLDGAPGDVAAAVKEELDRALWGTRPAPLDLKGAY
ncbi:thioesterase II family protein [Streptomyces sp. NPDC048441]|uniref:thioesterase II family protein n=1 Tax=Streptomyces sp. NPDC048441 TaxID=3365552 RepID=UPI003718B6BA